MIRLRGMLVVLKSGAPEPENDGEIVFQEFGPGDLWAPLAEMDFRPVLKRGLATWGGASRPASCLRVVA